MICTLTDASTHSTASLVLQALFLPTEYMAPCLVQLKTIFSTLVLGLDRKEKGKVQEGEQ
jgi:hypothetical protein